MASFWTRVGALSGACAVGLGAFGAHGLKNHVTDDKMMEAWKTASSYHLAHSLAIVLAPIANKHATTHWSARLFFGGTLLFAGSLYAMVLTDVRKLGAITPIGGTALIGGWICLAAGS